MNDLIIKPVISEKSFALSESKVYTFEVPLIANKIEIASKVSEVFKVDVTRVRVNITKGKAKTFKGTRGKRKDIKKAYITLKKGQSIKIFETEDDKKKKKPKSKDKK